MKKSIKYAGIAAATLLAVAPVAAPVVSSTTNVQAATTDTDQSKQDTAVTEFGKQFADKKATLVDSSKVILGTVNASDFAQNDAALLTGAASDVTLLNSKGTAQVTVSAKYGNTAITTSGDLKKVLADTTYPEVVFTIVLNYNNLNGVAQSKTYTVKATRDASHVDVHEMTQAKATFTTPLSVALDTTTTSTTLDVSNDATIKDQDGNSVLTANDNVTADAKFYDTYSAAMDAAKAGKAGSVTASTNVGSNADVNNGQESFLKAGSYYQVINFTAAGDSSLSDFLTKYTTNPAKYSVYVNGKQASAGYDFVNNGSTVSFVREINVSNTTDQWTTTDTTGVVTTKSASKYYTLKNDDNDTIGNRALGANTPWRTDKVRTNQDGVKQYRVATGEWIDANNVTFSDKATTPSDNSALTDIQNQNGTVTLDAPASFNYLLYTKSGELGNRALSGDSAWKVIQTAKDSKGRTYYRVSTTEWVMEGNGVHFTAE